jgi:hypothetical protein
MFASWPMVFGALGAGLLLGLLVPAPDREPSSQTAATATVAKKETASLAPKETPAPTTKAVAPSANPTKPASTDTSAAPATQPVKAGATPAKQDGGVCAQQTWPYHDPSCFDPSATGSRPVKTITARRADPAIALRSEESSKRPARGEQPAKPATARAPETKAETKQATAPTEPVETQQPARVASPGPLVPSPPAQAARAPATESQRPAEPARPRVVQRQPRAQVLEGPDGETRVFIQRDGTRIYVRPMRPMYGGPMYGGPWQRW